MNLSVGALAVPAETGTASAGNPTVHLRIAVAHGTAEVDVTWVTIVTFGAKLVTRVDYSVNPGLI
ncbi:hypothetical protein J2S92_003978 [Arthrobacter bambusae]|nr:hypothetical protein [Arthrobacter bambusae]MDQ0235884.1 hypothetical protein [Arthrobacter bambusae]